MRLCRDFAEYFPVSRFLRLSRSQDINFFLEQIFTIGIILNETVKTKSVKIY